MIMKTEDYNNLIQFTKVYPHFVPVNEPARNLLQDIEDGEIVYLKQAKQRDLKLHRCYMLLLSYIHSYLPKTFQNAVPKNKFYQFLKQLKSEYKVIFAFKDGSKMIEYESISFSKMDEQKFRSYIKEQLPFIYSDVIGAYYSGTKYNSIIENIEEEFEKFFTKLFSK